MEADIAHGIAQRDDLLAKCLKEIIDEHEKIGRASLEIIYAKLKDMFEGTYTKSGTELPTATHDVVKENSIFVNESHEEITLTYVVCQNSHVASLDETISAKNTSSGSQYVSAFVKRQRLSQGLYRCTERNEKERKI